MSEKDIWKKYEEKLEELWYIVKCDARFKGKLKGAIVANLVAELIRDCLGENSKYKVSANNVFIEGYGTEFDLLILKKEATPIKEGYPVFKVEDVKAVIECKATGVFFNSKNEKNPLEKELKTIEHIKNEHKIDVGFGYFTMQEQIPVKKNSIDFLAKTNKWINDFIPIDKKNKSVFCIANNNKLPKLYENNYSFMDWVENLIY